MLLLFHRILLFFLSLEWAVTASGSGAPSKAADLPKMALDLQLQLITSTTLKQRRALEQQLDSTIELQVDELKETFRNTPRPADRIDDGSISTRDLPVDTPLWYLMEIPQWWVTAKVLKVLPPKNQLLVLVTATGEERTVTRGQHVRVVRVRVPQDQMIWDSEFLRDQGELARLHNHQDERKQKYGASLQIDPTNPHPMDNLGLYYKEQGDVDKSKYWLEKSIQANPNWYHAYYNLGLLYRDQQHSTQQIHEEKAFKLFQTAWQLNPLFLDSLWNIAELHFKAENYPQECYHWRLLRVLNRNPSPDVQGQRVFPVWNEQWEDFTTTRIQQCMSAMGQEPLEDVKEEL